jgi:hypothetical protein
MPLLSRCLLSNNWTRNPCWLLARNLLPTIAALHCHGSLCRPRRDLSRERKNTILTITGLTLNSIDRKICKADSHKRGDLIIVYIINFLRRISWIQIINFLIYTASIIHLLLWPYSKVNYQNCLKYRGTSGRLRSFSSYHPAPQSQNTGTFEIRRPFLSLKRRLDISDEKPNIPFRSFESAGD